MAKVKEVLEDAKFNEFLGYEIEAYNNRPEPKEEAEALEYECTNNNPYGLKEYREGCTQHCDECDYYQPIKK